jgi:hypothetical protein
VTSLSKLGTFYLRSHTVPKRYECCTGRGTPSSPVLSFTPRLFEPVPYFGFQFLSKLGTLSNSVISTKLVILSPAYLQLSSLYTRAIIDCASGGGA